MSERQEQYNAALERLADQPITKEQIAEFERQQDEAFNRELNELCNRYNRTLTAKIFVSSDGRLVSDLVVVRIRE